MNDFQFSKIKRQELIDLLEIVKNFNYEYLDKVNLPSNLHFGIEIEVEKGLKNTIKEKMRIKYKAIEIKATNKNIIHDFNKWHVSNDASLKNGLELSSPIFNDSTENWYEIKDVCELLSKYKTEATDRTGAHIHFGASFLEDYQNFINLIKIYSVYENILIKFGYGKIGIPRPGLEKYAKPVADKLIRNINLIVNSHSLNELKGLISPDKHLSMNLKNVNWSNINDENKNTIEFRSSNGTTDYITWQNLVNTYGHLLNASISKQIDDEHIKYKLRHYYLKNKDRADFYTKIYLKECLELADIIFDNVYDKIMFIKQYLSNADINKLQNKYKGKTICKK